MRACEICVEGLSAHRVVDKLRAEGITVLSARRAEKNLLVVTVEAKARKKVFAILRGSCYNIKKVSPVGLERLRESAFRGVGLFIGAAIALCGIFFLQSRVLRVQVEGSGSYLSPEVRAILAEEGVTTLSAMPKDRAAISARILSLPRVSFCSVKGEGGVLTVNVEVSDETSPLIPSPLRAPAAGVVEELIVIRGTPLVQVGDTVGKGDEVVGNFVTLGEEEKTVTRTVVVIARVRVRYEVAAEYELGEEQAVAQAMLDFGELTDIRTEQTNTGWRILGIGHAETSLNFT